MVVDFKATQAREESLKKRVVELTQSLQNERDTRIDYNILHREVDTNRSQYEALLQRLKEVSIASGVGSSQVSVVDRAEAPRLPFSPDVGGTLTRAFALSLALALALAFALEYIDDTVRTPEDMKIKLGLACLGVVPKAAADVDVVSEMRNPKSPISEAFFSARTALKFSTASGAPATIVVTGTRPGEGKTSAALGLALSFAAIGERVLIIDADMRKPSFVSPQNRSIGLSGLLTGDGVVFDHIIPGEVPNLDLLPSGVVPPNPAELLASPRLKSIIAMAKMQYDLVVIDSAPVLNFADALLLAASAEAVVVVMQTGVIRRVAAQRTLERLADVRAVVIGGILSKFEAKHAAYGYGYGYGYGGYKGADGAVDSAVLEAESRRRIRLFSPDDDRRDASRSA